MKLQGSVDDFRAGVGDLDQTVFGSFLSVHFLSSSAKSCRSGIGNCSEMAKKPKTAKALAMRKHNPDAFELFLFGTAYLKGAAAMGRELKLPAPYYMPMFVVEAFSVELHLKCLLRSERKVFKTPTHDIEKLYKMLSSKNRRLIRETAGMSLGQLRSFFARTAGIFQNLRYMHEGHEWPKDKKGRHGNFGTYEFVWAIRELLDARHPDWEERKNKILYDKSP